MDFNEARDDTVAVVSAGSYAKSFAPHTDNHASTLSLQSFTGWMLFLIPNQQYQSTEDKYPLQLIPDAEPLHYDIN